MFWPNPSTLFRQMKRGKSSGSTTTLAFRVRSSSSTSPAPSSRSYSSSQSQPSWSAHLRNRKLPPKVRQTVLLSQKYPFRFLQTSQRLNRSEFHSRRSIRNRSRKVRRHFRRSGVRFRVITLDGSVQPRNKSLALACTKRCSNFY
jgi:hypothetical protein